MPSAPPNAYQEGTKLTVGSHKVSIIKYISQGGFAHVYTCHIDPPFQGSDVACLKRVVVPSKWQLSLLRQEVDAMRRLRGNKHIVSYIDSHASRLNSQSTNSTPQQQQYEVFLLMEYCERNGLIDFMNTRLVHKLTEAEIIDIMYQVTIGVAMCHHLRPQLIHRDIKIENVLIDGKGVFKLCDFGSSVNYLQPPKSPQELQLMKDDLLQHTTPQYRAPEMIDLTKGFPIDDKLDIWALGIFLYKLCYYTTPFELPNQSSLQELDAQILNCSETLRFRDQPGLMFSARLKNMIKVCLRGDPRRRPNAVQLLGEIVSMKGETTMPDVIPYSVREQLKVKQNEDAEKKKPLQPVAALPNKPPKRSTKEATTVNKTDPFAGLDRTQMLKSPSLNKGSSRPQLPDEPKSRPARPLSAFYDGNVERIYSQGNKSTPSIQDHVKKELRKSQVYDFEDSGTTLSFLKSREEGNGHSIHTRNDTGGSIKAAIKNNIRKISTGSSITLNNTGGSIKHIRKRSIQSIKQIITGGGNNGHSEEKAKSEQNQPEEIPAKKLSIQKRMQMLFNQNENQTVPKVALGYGRFTEINDSDDIEAINIHADLPTRSTSIKKTLLPPKVPLGLSSKRESIENRNVKSATENRDVKPSDKGKAPPPKPKKPVYLKSPGKPSGYHMERKSSVSSEISLPDVDDLEKDFAKRFPSYV